MRIVKGIAIFVGAFIGSILIVGFLLPSRYDVMRATIINAPAEKVYALVASPRQWPRWSVWNERDPNMKITYTGPESGKGATWAWDSKTEGQGAMEFNEAEPYRRVEYILTFPGFGSRTLGALTLQPEGTATRLTWTMRGDVGGNPLKHYFAALMDRMVGPDLEGGLARLKALAEKP
jgi:uncharacterized protein YndB with AHSA1/START domain